jgi:hypothetical protein
LVENLAKLQAFAGRRHDDKSRANALGAFDAEGAGMIAL